MWEYYDRWAPEVERVWRDAGREDESLAQAVRFEAHDLVLALRELPPSRVLDVGCGTGYLTCQLKGEVCGLDQSHSMLSAARKRVPRLVRGDGLALPFHDRSFDRVFTSHVYSHLQPQQRTAFIEEARRVAPELVVVDAAEGDAPRRDPWEERTLEDGRRYLIYKQVFTPEGLLDELGGHGTVLFRGRHFVGVTRTWQ